MHAAADRQDGEAKGRVMAESLVEFEHVEEALKGFPMRSDIAERMASWVAEVLFASQAMPRVQRMLADLLREEGWVCTPPADVPAAADGRG